MTHLRQQAAHDDDIVPAQVGRNLAAAEDRIGGEDLVDRLHQIQRLGADPAPRVVKRRPAQLQQPALAIDAEIAMDAADERLLLGGAHLLSP